MLALTSSTLSVLSFTLTDTFVTRTSIVVVTTDLFHALYALL